MSVDLCVYVGIYLFVYSKSEDKEIVRMAEKIEKISTVFWKLF